MHGLREAMEQLAKKDPITGESEFRYFLLEESLALESVQDLDALQERLRTMSAKEAISYRDYMRRK